MLDDIRGPRKIAGDHEHNYYPFEKMQAFEPASFIHDDEGHEIFSLAGRDLYQRVEYLILSCKCGDVIKRRVRSVE